MPNEGVFICQKISRDKAYHLFWTEGFVNTAAQGLGASPDDLTTNYVSAIGHQATADAFNAIFKPNPTQEVHVNRIPATMSRDDVAICLKVLGRLQEGQILTLEELERVGYEFYLVKMIATDHNELETDACYAGAAPITGHIWSL